MNLRQFIHQNRRRGESEIHHLATTVAKAYRDQTGRSPKLQNIMSVLREYPVINRNGLEVLEFML